MVSFVHSRDTNSVELYKYLKELPKIPGVCIFIDIVNSTAIKYKTGIEHWGRLLNNTFNMINFLNDFPDYIVKGIGDELMLYIPDEALSERKEGITDYFSLLFEIYATIDNIKNYPLEDVFLNCKVGIHYCTDVYNITYFDGVNDYYGKDIDLTARIMGKSNINRIVMSEAYYQKVMINYAQNPIYEKECLPKLISEKYMADFRGVPNPTSYRIIEV